CPPFSSRSYVAACAASCEAPIKNALAISARCRQNRQNNRMFLPFPAACTATAHGVDVLSRRCHRFQVHPGCNSQPRNCEFGEAVVTKKRREKAAAFWC